MSDFAARARRVRRLPFPIRPLHRETIGSFLGRLMRANFMEDAHRRHIERAWRQTSREKVGITAWWAILQALTGRTFASPARTVERIPHPDGETCAHCMELLPNRWMCLLCAKGELVQQYPHFDEVVCVKHGRWVGLHDDPRQQHPVGREDVRAAIVFKKLRRQRRLDVRLFTLLLEATGATSRSGRDDGAFGLTILLARLVTSPEFMRTVYDPIKSFAESFASLESEVTRVGGLAAIGVARPLWLYMRPTFRFLQAVHSGAPTREQWAHDHVVPERVTDQWRAHKGTRQPFSEYLQVTGDDAVSAFRYGLSTGDRATINDEALPYSLSLHVCDNGHEYEGRVAPAAGSRLPRVPSCPICHGRQVFLGVNDLASQYPRIARELSAARNGGLLARDISSHSKAEAVWQCPSGHEYTASPLNRTANSLTCPICQNRLIVAGINDLTTTHPDIAEEWHPQQLGSPTTVSAGSKSMAHFECKCGHEYFMRVVERVAIGSCPECAKAQRREARTSLDQTHPHLATEWDVERNGERRLSDFTHGSKHVAYWECRLGHSYRQRIERKVKGYGCSVCSNRSFVSGANDIATLHPELAQEFHPYLNEGRKASETQAGSARYWWLCGCGHKTQQSIAHRLDSSGCSECPPEARLLAA